MGRENSFKYRADKYRDNRLVDDYLMYNIHRMERENLARTVSVVKIGVPVMLGLLLAAVNLPILLAWGTGAAPVATAMTLSTLLVGSGVVSYAKNSRMEQELKLLDRQVEEKKSNNEERGSINAFSKGYRDEVKNYKRELWLRFYQLTYFF